MPGKGLRGQSTFVAVLCAALSLAPLCFPASSGAEESTAADEFTLRRTIETITHQQGELSRDLISPLTELSQVYAETDRCPDAVATLNYALNVSRQLDGLFNPEQLEFFGPLLNCYLTLDQPIELERLLHHAVLINEHRYGKNDPRILPALQNAAQWYEQAGEYTTARELYGRALKISRKAGGDEDVRQVEPLRGIARACRLEHQFQETDRALDALGERSLERAVEILRASTAEEVNPAQRVETFLDLGDWYQMTGARRDAVKIYKEVWQLDPTLFREPQPILYRALGGIALRRPPPAKEGFQHFKVDLTFTVTREGQVTNVTVTDTESGPPKDAQYRAMESLKRTRFRPRFENGEPVDTPNHHVRQGIYVAR